jgi:hypothetical protein
MPYAYWLLSDGQTGKNYICTDAYFAKELNFVIYILSDWLAAGQAGSTAEQCSRTVQRKVRSPSEVRIACSHIQLPWPFLTEVLQNDKTRYICALFVLISSSTAFM